MKEIVIRIWQSAKEPIHGMTRRKGESIFHCSVGEAETLIQEELNCGQVISLRLRQLANPLPEVMLKDFYKTVTKLELSCPVEVSWVFSLASVLPVLNIVRFGASCFEVPFGDCSPVGRSWLKKCISVKELIISFDHRKLLHDDYATHRIMFCINEILDYTTTYFCNLSKTDLYMPYGVKLELFLKNNPSLAETGDKVQHLEIGMIRFQSHCYNEKRKPAEVPSRRHSNSSGSDTPSSATLVEHSVTLEDPRKTRIKRGISSTTSEHSSEADDDFEGPLRPSKIKSKGRPLSPLGHDVIDYSHDPYVVTPLISEYNPAYYSRSKSDQPDSLSSPSSTEASPPSSTTEPSYADFSQMYTRR